MTTYHLAISQQTDTAVHMLAELNTENATTMAATLRAVADRLDPPKPAQPVYRGAWRPMGPGAWSAPLGTPDPAPGDHMRSAYTVEGRTGTRDRVCNQPGHGTTGCDCPPLTPDAAETVARVKADEGRTSRRNLVTPDGCGPEHTHSFGCALWPGLRMPPGTTASQ